MCAQKYITGEPYRLLGKRILFTNWKYVRPCLSGWFDQENNNVSVNGPQGPNEAHIVRYNHPFGIRPVFSRPERTGPFMDAVHPWEEGGVSIINIIRQDGIYRAWGDTGWGDLGSRGSQFYCYFESYDGYEWKRPDCGLVEYDGSKKNNILGREGGTVFIDPAAPDEERYKWIRCSHISKKQYEEYMKIYPDDIDIKCKRTDADIIYGVTGAVSADGLHWGKIGLPLVMIHSDTQIVAYYDQISGKYVGYFRDWAVSAKEKGRINDSFMSWFGVARRAIGRSETSDFKHFPLSKTIIEPDLSMDPSHTYYTNCKTTVPGAPGDHLMFPAIYDQANDMTHIEILSSSDGEVWNRISSVPVLETAGSGKWDGGCIFAVPDLLELPNGDFALPYMGYNVPHKYPRQKAIRSLGYAVWPKGRMTAIEAKEKGGFSTVSIVPPGKRLYINAVTGPSGSILTEVCKMNGDPVPGRSFNDAIPVSGDAYKKLVIWKGCDDLGADNNEAVFLRFKLDEAKIYCLDFSSRL